MKGYTAAICAIALLLICGGVASATGTVLVQQSDGTRQTYDGVNITLANKTLRLTSADKKGAIVVDRAACSYVGEILRCLPTSVKLDQGGVVKPVDFKRGTIYLNLTNERQQLPFSSQQLPPHGIMLSLTTRIGTIVNSTGAIDK